MARKREIGYAVLLCAAGAGLALYAANRAWTLEMLRRPEPMPLVREERTGADIMPWLPALAVVALAGAGAIIATRGAARALLGVLVLLAGVGVAAGGAYGLTESIGWPLACVAGGLLAAAGGALTAARGRRWPSLGTRYERAPERTSTGPTDTWDALDRGEDPTVR